MMLTILKLRQTSADGGYTSAPAPKKAWDCGCRRHLKAGSEEALIAKVIYHLAVQHPEAHPTMEQADELHEPRRNQPGGQQPVCTGGGLTQNPATNPAGNAPP